jgi:hypothetical protein
MFQNPVQILQDIVVDVSNHLKAKGLKISVTQLILWYLISTGMTIAVYFNHKRLLRAKEVHNVWPDAMLPTKLESLKLSCS